MGKKKKAKRQGHSGPRPQVGQQWSAPEMDAETLRAKTEAVRRLKGALHYMSEPPEPIMAFLERLAIPVREVNFESSINAPGLDAPIIKGKYFLISVEDMFAGEERNQEQGSVIKRLYGAEAEAEMKAPAGNRSNPLEGEVLPKSPLHMTDAQKQQLRDSFEQMMSDRAKQMNNRRTVVDAINDDEDHDDTLRRIQG